ncbi:hypothetical protein NXT3_PB00383 (plasmid) [Sinorhizobium fredii]|uniref:Uncharacterized protein n=1 Tax=Rhizobium fredii TaxID=380 RepID=A0A2L0HC12_RHIFR|nr:hypothetical protein NXT3_PB00383 [Sinorhizobium fredii]
MTLRLILVVALQPTARVSLLTPFLEVFDMVIGTPDAEPIWTELGAAKSHSSKVDLRNPRPL